MRSHWYRSSSAVRRAARRLRHCRLRGERAKGRAGLRDERGRVAPARERLALQDVDGQLSCRGHSLELEFCQRPARPADRGRPVLGPHEHLGDQRVVVGRDHIAVDDVGVDPDAGPERRPEARHRAGRGQEVARGILRVDAQLDRVAAQLGSARFRQPLPRRDAELGLGEVDPGDQLRDGMLDLEPGVHLDEVEVPVGVQEELERARAAVAQRLGRPACSVLHRRRGARARPPATAPPRRASGDGAGWSSPARPASARRPRRRRAPGSPRGARRRARARRRATRPRTPPRPRRRRSGTRTPGRPDRSTSRMPRPPPPAEAFRRSGKPTSPAIARACSRLAAPFEPGTSGSPASAALRLALTLSPMSSIDSGRGPTKARSLSSQAAANSARSARKPQPGCTASQPVVVAAATSDGMLR